MFNKKNISRRTKDFVSCISAEKLVKINFMYCETFHIILHDKDENNML